MPVSTRTFDPEHPIIQEELRKAGGQPIPAYFAIKKHAPDALAGHDALKFAGRVLDHYGRTSCLPPSLVKGFAPTREPAGDSAAPSTEAPAPSPEAGIQEVTKATTNGKFTMVSNAILQDDTIPFVIKGIYATAISYGKARNKDGSRPAQPGYPSIETLARKGRCSKRTVLRGINFLEKRGHLKIARRPGTTSLYLP